MTPEMDPMLEPDHHLFKAKISQSAPKPFFCLPKSPRQETKAAGRDSTEVSIEGHKEIAQVRATIRRCVCVCVCGFTKTNTHQ